MHTIRMNKISLIGPYFQDASKGGMQLSQASCNAHVPAGLSWGNIDPIASTTQRFRDLDKIYQSSQGLAKKKMLENFMDSDHLGEMGTRLVRVH